MSIKISDFTMEDEVMVGKQGYGSVYFNKSRNCYQAAFYVNQLDSNGKKIRKILSAPTEEEAMCRMVDFINAGMASLTEQKTANPVYPSSPCAPAVSVQYHRVCDIWKSILDSKIQMKDSTRRWYNDMGSIVIKEIGDLNIEELSKEDIIKFHRSIATRQDGKMSSDKRIKEIDSILKSIIRYAINEDYITKNPYNSNVHRPEGYKRDQRENVYSLDEIDKILEMLNSSSSLVLRTVIPLLLISGLRINELMGLKYSDLDKEGGVINVHRQVTGRKAEEKKMGSLKGRMVVKQCKDRVVPVPPIFFDIVENWRLSRLESGYIQKAAIKGNADVIFANRTGDLRSDNTVRKYCREFLKSIYLWHEGTVFHGFRRTYATLMDRAGVDERVISKLLGHEVSEEKNCAVALQHYIKPDNARMELKKKEAVSMFMDYAGAVIVNNIKLTAA